MRKILFISAACALLAALLASAFLFDRSAPLSPTAKRIKLKAALAEGSSLIVCEDALWLYETNKKLIKSKLEQMEDMDNLTKEDFAALRKAVTEEKSDEQKALEAWLNEAKTAVGTSYRDAESHTLALGDDFLRIYQAAMMVKLELAEETYVLEVLKERFCRE